MAFGVTGTYVDPASKRVYLDGKELPPERPVLAPGRCGSAAECAEEAAGGGKRSAESADERAGSGSADASREGGGAATAVSSSVSGPAAVSVTANDKKIAHRGSCHMAKTRGATDVCWAGGDDTPAAFENTGYMSALTDATTRTFIQRNPVWIQSARLKTSMASHPAKPIGLVSGKPHMNEVRAINWSRDVLFEGRGVVRADDATIQNMMNTIGKILEGPAVAHPGALEDSALREEVNAFLVWANKHDSDFKGKIDMARVKDPRELLRLNPLLRRKWYDHEQQRERDKLGKTSLEILSNGIQRARWVQLPLETGRPDEGPFNTFGSPVSELAKDISVMSHGHESATEFMAAPFASKVPGGSYLISDRFEPYQFGHRSDTGYKREYWDLAGDSPHEDQNHHLNFFLANNLRVIGDGGGAAGFTAWNAFGLIHDVGVNKPDRELAYSAPALARVVADPSKSNTEVNDYIWSTYGDPTYVDERAESARYNGPWCAREPDRCLPEQKQPEASSVPDLQDIETVKRLLESNFDVPSGIPF